MGTVDEGSGRIRRKMECLVHETIFSSINIVDYS